MGAEFNSSRSGRTTESSGRTRNLSLSKAELCLKINQVDRCIAETQSILADDPEHVGALEIMAKALWQTGDYEALLTTLDKLIALNPYEPGYHGLRGAACQSLGRLGDAVRCFARADHSEEVIAELHEWEAELVASLIREDRVFRAHYAQDPEAACLARGFAFIDKPVRKTLVADRRESATLYTRPS